MCLWHIPCSYTVGADAAQKFTLDQAKALAMTWLDVLCQPDLLLTINSQFQQAKIADIEA